MYNYDGYTKRPEAAPDIGQHSRTNISLTYKTRGHEEGLVELRKGDEVWYKLIDELTREDRPARIESENTRSFWIAERLKRRTQPQ